MSGPRPSAVVADGIDIARHVDSTECVELMREFIAAHPEVWNEDIGEE